MKLWKEEQDIKKLTRYQTRKGGTDCSKMLFLINLFLVITNNSLLVTGSFFSFLSLLVKKIMTYRQKQKFTCDGDHSFLF